MKSDSDPNGVEKCPAPGRAAESGISMQKLQSIWAVGESKVGDNSQLLRAVSAMNMPFAYKHIVIKPGAGWWNRVVRPTISHVDTSLSDPLGPPWPDLLVTIGRELSSVALWVKQQSGGKTRIALFNAPRAHAADFDLILLCSLYGTEDGAHILRYRFPLTSIGQEQASPSVPVSADNASKGCALHVLLVGGPTKSLLLDPPSARLILEKMRSGHARGGTIAIVTSRRTPRAVINDLAARLMPGETLYRWKAHDDCNPYRALLARGTTFTVTGDSLSMLIDVASQGKTLVIAPLPRARLAAVTETLGAVSRRLLGWLALPAAVRRDYQRFHRTLIVSGYAVSLGDPPVAPIIPFPDESQRVAEALKRLLAPS